MQGINVVIYDPATRQIIHSQGMLQVPPEVFEQTEDDNPTNTVTQFARKLRLLAKDETLWVAA